MRNSDATKQRAIQDDVKRSVDALKKQPRTQTIPKRVPETGAAIVQRSVAFGDGSLCEIEVVSSSGAPTGVRANNVPAGARVAVGTVVQYIRHPDGSFQIGAGGTGSSNGSDSSSSSATTENDFGIVGYIRFFS